MTAAAIQSSTTPPRAPGIVAEAPWPREHGAWAMLGLPIVLGFAVAQRIDAASVWVAASLVLLFLSRAAIVPTLARRRQGRSLATRTFAIRLGWGAGELFAASACLAAVFAARGPARRSELAVALALPVVLGAAHAVFGIFGADRRLPGELVGMVGLASATPLVAAAAGVPPGPRSYGAAALGLAYFLSSLAYVRAYRRKKAVGRIDVRGCAWAHAGIVAALSAAWAAGVLPVLALAAFVPVIVRTAVGLARPPRDLGTLGRREIAVAVTFSLAAVGAYLA